MEYFKKIVGKNISNGHRKPRSSPTHFMIVHMDQRIIKMICNMNDQIRKLYSTIFNEVIVFVSSHCQNCV
jgi:hypothetical protein